MSRTQAGAGHGRFIGTQLAECDSEIEQQLQNLQVQEGEPATGKQCGRARNAPNSTCAHSCSRCAASTWTRIDGIDVTTALAVISEAGADVSRFTTVRHFDLDGFVPGRQDHRRQSDERQI